MGTRSVLIGIGALPMVVGYLVSTLISGITTVFIILGLVMWPRHDDDWVRRPAATYLSTPDDAAAVVAHAGK